MRTIKCAYCGKHLFNTDKSEGAAMSEAKKLGFVPKMPFLYGISGCFFFCNKDCYKAWSNEHISEEAKANGDKAIAELKEKIPEAIEGALKAAQKFVEAIKKKKKYK